LLFTFRKRELSLNILSFWTLPCSHAVKTLIIIFLCVCYRKLFKYITSIYWNHFHVNIFVYCSYLWIYLFTAVISEYMFTPCLQYWYWVFYSLLTKSLICLLLLSLNIFVYCSYLWIYLFTPCLQYWYWVFYSLPTKSLICLLVLSLNIFSTSSVYRSTWTHRRRCQAQQKGKSFVLY
jgi:hypothetical protein